MAIEIFLQAGKENSQKQVLAYFERTAIGKPDSVFYFRPQMKIGHLDCSWCQFFKIFGFWENSLPACNLGEIPKIIFTLLGYKTEYKCALLYGRVRKKFSVFRLWNVKKCPWIYRGVWKILWRNFGADRQLLRKTVLG